MPRKPIRSKAVPLKPKPGKAAGPTKHTPPASEDVPLTVDEACAFFGGSKPIDRSTYYRGVKAGRYPKPFNVAPNLVRVMRSWCETARNTLAARGDNMPGGA